MDKLDKQIKESYDQVEFEFSDKAWSQFKADWDRDRSPKSTSSWYNRSLNFAAGLIIGALIVWLLMKNGNTELNRIESDLSVRSEIIEQNETSKPLNSKSNNNHEQNNAAKTNINLGHPRASKNTYLGGQSNGVRSVHSILLNNELNRLKESFNKQGFNYGIAMNSYGSMASRQLFNGIEKPKSDIVDKMTNEVSPLELKSILLNPSYSISLFEVNNDRPVEPIRLPIRPRDQWYTSGSISGANTGDDLSFDPPTIQVLGGYEVDLGSWFLRMGIGFKNSDERRLSKSSVQVNPNAGGVNQFALTTNSIQYGFGELLIGKQFGKYNFQFGLQPSYIFSARGTINHSVGDDPSNSRSSNVLTTGLNDVQFDWLGIIEGPINDRLNWQLKLNVPLLFTEEVTESYNSLEIQKDQFLLGVGVTNYLK